MARCRACSSAWRKLFDLLIPNSPLGTVQSTKHLRLYHNGIFTSPTLYDPATRIGRSDPFVAGDPAATAGTLTGQYPGRTYIREDQLVLHPNWSPMPASAKEVHTFLKSMHLTDSLTTRFGFSVKAGMLAPTRPVSAGRVEGLSDTSDFPANSFFNVYVVVDLPAGGLLWTPTPQVRFDIFFPQPKLSAYLTTVGRYELWGYIAGEYGGGAWTIQRTSGVSDRVDINDIRVSGGFEWTGPRGLTGFIEGGFVFRRQVIYVVTPADSFNPGDTYMVRAGFSF